MNDKEFVEYIKKHGWIEPLNELSLEELFKLQRELSYAIENTINRLKNNLVKL